MSETLALFGGTPVRGAPYPVHDTMVDEAEEREVLEVLRGKHLSGFSARPGDRFRGGEKVQALEAAFAKRFAVPHAVSFNSATSALHAMVAAIGVGPGDEVIVPPTTMSATATAVVMANGVPVFADIEDETYGLDPAAVEAAITPRTRAILAVNLFGHPARLKELEAIAARHGIVLLEDNAQGPTATEDGRLAGTIGRMGVQSLNYHKAIQTGEGGICLATGEEDALRLELIRNHAEVVIGKMGAEAPADIAGLVGYNYRLSELQAAVGIPQVAKLDALIERRAALAGRLSAELAAFDFLAPPKVRAGCTSAWYLYAVRYRAEALNAVPRALFLKALAAEGVAVAGGYVTPIYLEPMFQQRIAYGRQGCPFACPLYEGTVDYGPGRCPTAERLYAEELFTTDICKWPNTTAEVDEFVAALAKVAANADALKARAEDVT